MTRYFGHDFEAFPFDYFSISHIFMIILLFVGGTFIFFSRKYLQRHDFTARMTMFALLFLLELMYHIWLYKDGYWDVSFALPLQLCSISLILCLVLLWTKSHFVFQVVYYMGITGAVMAIFTPELFLGYPHFRFFQFFITHCLIIWTCLYFVLVLGYKSTIRGLFSSFFFLNGCAVVAFFMNKVTDGNYMFLASKPTNGSLLDYFGPYPFYILTLEAVALFLFFLLWLPFMKKR